MDTEALAVNASIQEETPEKVHRVRWELAAVLSVCLLQLAVFEKDRFSWLHFAGSWWYELAVLAVLSLIVGIFCHLAMEVAPLKQKNATMEKCYSALIAKTESQDQQRLSIDRVYQDLRAWFDLDSLPPDLSKEDPVHDSQCLAALHRAQLQVASTLKRLLIEKKVEARYRDQIELAGVLSSLAEKRFWATSADSVSQFQVRNHYYLQILERVGKKIQPTMCEGVPPLARVFIGKKETFLAEITGDTQGAVLALYEWHLKWMATGPKDGSGGDCEPLHFFMENRAHVDDYFDKHNVPGFPIKDFMLVDDRFIYGRQGEVMPKVQLAFDSQPSSVASYMHLFPDVWANSLSMDGMLEHLLLTGEKSTEISAFKEQCEKRRSKLHVTREYESRFPSSYDRDGAGFLKKTCELIGKSRGTCFAVDRADHKAGNLLSAWRTDRSYSMFLEASKIAAPHAAAFQRLYVIDAKLSGDREDIVDFIMDSVDAQIDVGFCFASDMIATETSKRFDSDFIITNYGGASPLGFELQDAGFTPAALEWTTNLIATEWMGKYRDKFWENWNAGTTTRILKGAHRRAVREQIAAIWEGVSR